MEKLRNWLERTFAVGETHIKGWQILVSCLVLLALAGGMVAVLAAQRPQEAVPVTLDQEGAGAGFTFRYPDGWTLDASRSDRVGIASREEDACLYFADVSSLYENLAQEEDPLCALVEAIAAEMEPVGEVRSQSYDYEGEPWGHASFSVLGEEGAYYTVEISAGPLDGRMAADVLAYGPAANLTQIQAVYVAVTESRAWAAS